MHNLARCHKAIKFILRKYTIVYMQSIYAQYNNNVLSILLEDNILFRYIYVYTSG